MQRKSIMDITKNKNQKKTVRKGIRLLRSRSKWKNALHCKNTRNAYKGYGRMSANERNHESKRDGGGKGQKQELK